VQALDYVPLVDALRAAFRALHGLLVRPAQAATTAFAQQYPTSGGDGAPTQSGPPARGGGVAGSRPGTAPAGAPATGQGEQSERPKERSAHMLSCLLWSVPLRPL